MEKDYLIVGQGLSGSILAFELLTKGKSVVVVDEGLSSSASKVAAGLYNPIVFKRLTKSWMVDELLEAALKFYTKLEEKLEIKVHHQRQIVKLFASDEEKNFWFKKAATIELQNYLESSPATDIPETIIHAKFGAATVKQAGNILPQLLIAEIRQFLVKNDSFIESKFDFESIHFNSETVRWKEVVAKKIIFCEGYSAIHNPYFNWLPFVLTKGETLTIRIDNFPLSKVVNKGVFILPLGNNIYKVGATYDWNDLSEAPTERGKQEILEKLNQVLRIPFEILDHQAGIRPTVKDRRPILGIHPQHPQLAIFNGMGTKAALIAPYFANQMLNFLEGKCELNEEVTIARYFSEFRN